MSDWKSYHFRVTGANGSILISNFYKAVKAFMLAQGWELVDTFEAVRSRVYLYGSNYFPNNCSVTINGREYTFKDALTPADGEVWKGASIADSFANLKLAVNRTDPETNDGVKYKIASAHPLWEATDVSAGSLYFDARVPGAGECNFPVTSFKDTNWFGWSGIAAWGRDAKTVWKSAGESGDEPPGYIWLFPTESYVYMRAYQYWNAAAHTGSRLNYSGAELMVEGFSATYDCMVSGDKDWISMSSHFASGVAYSRYGMIFGHIPKRCYPDIIKTTDAITAGNNIVIPVTDSSKVPGKGGYFQILGAEGEGCDRLKVVSLPTATSVLVENVPRNYAAGAFIGRPASTFFISAWYTGQGDQYLRQVSYPTDAGLTVSSNSIYASALGLYSPDGFSGKGNLTPIYFMLNGYPLYGYFDKGIFYFYGPGNYDVVCLNNDESMVTENILATSATNTSIADSTKNWTPSQFTGKFVVIVGGVGIGQVRKITGNDANSVSIGYPWYTNPDGTTTFRIYDTVYRAIPQFPFNQTTVHLITHTEVPG